MTVQIKSRRMWWVGHVARSDNILYLKETECEGVDWIHVVRVRHLIQW